jgi:hypothetical protein
MPGDMLAEGTLFDGRYRIVRPIRAGSMGSVYEVVDGRTNAARALKVMLPSAFRSADQRNRFAQEARVTGAVESDHLVRFFDVGVLEDGVPYLVMELLRGQELQEVLDARGALPPAEVVTHLGQVARALERTHAAGIIHRDLKPSNLFLSLRDDGTSCIKILDFGIAKIHDPSAADVKTRALGTPLFMAPEQIKGDGAIAPSADTYAMAHVAYALLTGEPYWKEEADAQASLGPMLRKVLAGAVEPPSARALRRKNVRIPPGFDAWFTRATAVDPRARFQSASEATLALGGALQPPPAPHVELPALAPAQPPAPPPVIMVPVVAPVVAPAAATQVSAQLALPPARTSSAMPLVAAAVGLVVLGGAGLGLFLLTRADGARDTTEPAESRKERKPKKPAASATATTPASAATSAGVPCWATKCAPLVVADATKADVLEILAPARALAQSVDAAAALSAITVQGSRGGVLDLTSGARISFTFVTPSALLAISNGPAGLQLNKSALSGFEGPSVPEPTACPSKTAASVAGLADGDALILYKHHVFGAAGGDGPYWLLTSAAKQVYVSPATCTVK